MFKDLREFIHFLENKGQLRRVTVPVDAELEITEIVDRICKRNGPALLFEQVKGYDIPVVINLFGSLERMSWALGVPKLDIIAQRMAELLSLSLPEGFLGKLSLLNRLREIGRFAPKTVRKAPCQEVVIAQKPSLDFLPILKCWPQDGGRFITLPLVITKNPSTGQQNMGIYRLQKYDHRTTGMHWHIHHDGARNYRQSQKLGRNLEVAVVLGGDPATIYAASAPLPPGFDELLLAGFLRKAPVEVVRCKTVDLVVPAHAEIILEGYVDATEKRLEGPFGDHTGFYSPAQDYPVFHLTCITYRKNPIYPATVVGRPPMEDVFLGKATERIFLPLLQMQVPEIVDLHLPLEGVFHNCAIVSIRKSYPGEARKVMSALWGLGQLALTKVIIVVDEDVDVQNLSQVAWKVFNNIDPERDFLFIKGPVDVLDHASSVCGYGSKVGIDATRKMREEGYERQWPEEVRMDEEIKRLVDQRWQDYGLD